MKLTGPTKIFIVIGLVLVGSAATLGIILSNTDAGQRIVRMEPRVYGSIADVRMLPTHIFFDTENDVEVISDFKNNRLLYRELARENDRNAWRPSNMESLRGPHALTYHPDSKRYFAVDTESHQVISFSELAGADSDIQRYSEIGGYSLGKRPHDIAYNAVDGHIYVLLNLGVIRFLPRGHKLENISFLPRAKINKEIKNKYPDKKFSVGYMRAITIVDGVLYLVNSTLGNVIQMDDFADPDTWQVHVNKDRPAKYAEAGSYDEDGLILNDVDYYKGYWYASNYYPSDTHNYLGSQSNIKNKVIRWKSWEDFYNSKWEDISGIAHPESIPYYFSKYENRFFISMFHIGNVEGEGSGVYEIKTSLF